MPGKKQQQHFEPYTGPAGGWGSARSVDAVLRLERVYFKGARVLAEQNRPKGFACVSCAWAKPGKPHVLEFCENGAKATAWEITSRRAGADFFAAHTLGELETWSDYDLEQQGRLTEPLRWDAATDRYLPVSWEEAFAGIGRSGFALAHHGFVIAIDIGSRGIEIGIGSNGVTVTEIQFTRVAAVGILGRRIAVRSLTRRIGIVPLEQRIAFQLGFDHRFKLKVRQLQQLDRLLQLGGDDQPLPLLEF